MKKIIYSIALLLSVGFLFSSCEKNAIPEVAETVKAGEGAYVKFFFHADTAPRANFYFNNQKVTATAPTSDGDVLGIAYGSIYPNNAYALVPSGSFTVSAIDTMLAGKGTAEVLAEASATFKADQNYSVYLVGSQSSSYEIFALEDNLPEPNHSDYHWRFVNTMVGIPFGVDAYAVRAAEPESETKPARPEEAILLGTNVGYKQASDYVKLDAGKYTIKLFKSGTTYDPYTSTPFMKHSYTATSVGRVYSTQIKGTYSETPKSNQIDYWRDR